MSGIVGDEVKFGRYLKRTVTRHRLHQLQNRIDVLRRVKRQPLRACIIVMFAFVQRVFLLQMAGIFQ